MRTFCTYEHLKGWIPHELYNWAEMSKGSGLVREGPNTIPPASHNIDNLSQPQHTIISWTGLGGLSPANVNISGIALRRQVLEIHSILTSTP